MDSVKSLTQAYSQAPWRKQTQIIGLFLLALVFSALVAGIYLSVTARAATIGREILMMQAEIEGLELTNADLQSDLALLKSAQMMDERARNLGFQPIDKDQATFVVVPGYIRPQRATLAPPPAPVTTVSASLPPIFTESLLDWLRQRISLPPASMLEVGP